jgi:hypothetical protein
VGYEEDQEQCATSDSRHLRLQHTAVRRLGMLFESYHVQCWWYEVLDLFRKLVLNGALVFVGDGSGGQVRPGSNQAHLPRRDQKNKTPTGAAGRDVASSVPRKKARIQTHKEPGT